MEEVKKASDKHRCCSVLLQNVEPMLCASGCFQMLPRYVAVSQRAPKFKPYIDSFGLILGHSSNLQTAHQNDTKMLQQILHQQKQNHSSPLNWNPSQHTDFVQNKDPLLEDATVWPGRSCNFSGWVVASLASLCWNVSGSPDLFAGSCPGTTVFPIYPLDLFASCPFVSLRFHSFPAILQVSINQSQPQNALQICKIESLSALAPFGLLAAHEIAPEATKQTEKYQQSNLINS